MPTTEEYLHFPSSASVGDVLQAYVDRNAQWWWLLTTEIAGEHYVCSFGSLLPYLTGRTPHIVHNIGDCAVCSGIGPRLWRGTGALVEEALHWWMGLLARSSYRICRWPSCLSLRPLLWTSRTSDSGS